MAAKVQDFNPTKTALSEAMKALLSEHPLDDIRISDITSRCGLSRKSFYLYFRDKYDLVQWIFDTEFLLKIDFEKIERTIDYHRALCEYLYENRAFYSHALQNKGQNSFSEYLSQLMMPLLIDHYNMERVCGEYMQECSEGIVDGFINFLTRWLTDWPYIKPEQFVALIYKNAFNISHVLLQDTVPGKFEHLKKLQG